VQPPGQPATNPSIPFDPTAFVQELQSLSVQIQSYLGLQCGIQPHCCGCQRIRCLVKGLATTTPLCPYSVSPQTNRVLPLLQSADRVRPRVQMLQHTSCRCCIASSPPYLFHCFHHRHVNAVLPSWAAPLSHSSLAGPEHQSSLFCITKSLSIVPFCSYLRTLLSFIYSNNPAYLLQHR
jgi:hypothetical protein